MVKLISQFSRKLTTCHILNQSPKLFFQGVSRFFLTWFLPRHNYFFGDTKGIKKMFVVISLISHSQETGKERKKEERKRTKVGREWLCLRAGGLDVKEQEGKFLRSLEHPRSSYLSNVCLVGEKTCSKFKAQASNLLFFILDEKTAIHRRNTAAGECAGNLSNAQPWKLQRWMEMVQEHVLIKGS